MKIIDHSDYMIYGLIDPRNGQLRYIGKTTQGFKRINCHFRRSVRNVETNLHKKYWLLQLNEANILPESVIIEHGFNSIEKLNEAEEFWISYFKGLGCNLVNLQKGGGSSGAFGHNKKNSYDTKIKISLGNGGGEFVDQLGNKYNLLKEASEKTGISLSNISKILRGKIKETRGFTFKYIQNIVKRPKKRFIKESNHPSRRMVICINDGKIYRSISEAARFYNLHKNSIDQILCGKYYSTRNGLIFKYLEGNN